MPKWKVVLEHTSDKCPFRLPPRGTKCFGPGTSAGFRPRCRMESCPLRSADEKTRPVAITEEEWVDVVVAVCELCAGCQPEDGCLLRAERESVLSALGLQPPK